MAGRIPQTFIDELLNRVDIVDVIDARVPLKKAGREYSACCPFHNEKTPSFTVSQAKQFYHCFGCGAHGSALGFLMDYEHLEFPEAVEELARSVGLEVPREAGAPRHDPHRHDNHYTLLERVDRFYRNQLRDHPQAAKAVEYLKNRGLSGEIARQFGLGYAPPGWDSLLQHLGPAENTRQLALELGLLIRNDDGRIYDRFRDRTMFPIRDRRGRTIAFGGRVLDDAKPKYMNSPESAVFHKGEQLYGLFEARKASQKLERLLVVEGYMDVVALAQFGMSNAVATLGTATTAEHLERLYRTVREVVFCFDGDNAGRRAAWRALENVLPVLRDGREARFLFLPEGEDPDSLIRKIGYESFLRDTVDSVPLSQFFFEQLSEQVDINSDEGRAQLVTLAGPLIGKLPDSVFRDLMLDRLAGISGVNEQKLRKRLQDPEQVTATPRRQAVTEAGRSPLVRTAIRLLLEQPELGADCPDPERFRDLRVAGISLLCELIEIARDNPHVSTAALLERMRGRSEEAHLARLAAQPLQVADNHREEFTGAIQRLIRQRDDQRSAELAAKGLNNLTDVEKKELDQLLGRRHPKPD